MVKVSAPGKVYLIGEHAVVYGQPAIIASVNKRTYVSIEPSKKITYRDLGWPDISHTWSVKELFGITEKILNLWDTCNNKQNFSELFNFIKKNGYEGYRASVVGIAMKRLGVKEGFSIIIDSQIPVGAGLGSSASRAVSITKAIAQFFKKKISLERINEIAYLQEKVIHGIPSGGDNSTCCFGGLVWFKKTQPSNEIRFLKKEIPYKLENFVFVYTGEPKKTTGEMVQLVRELKEEYRAERIKKIGEMSYEMLESLKRKDFKRMKEIINQTQKNLTELGASTKEIDKVVKAVQKVSGAAKLCGAGGGGIVLCYHEEKKKLIDLIRNIGYDPWEMDLAVEGVRIERDDN
ncbi:MAG: mevalonate kinase [Patescibacteria group bacterium]|nr:mevalonate kinase [Patescibacteria group bacterium]